MIKTLALANGNFVSMAIAEVVSVPYFELYAKDLDRANYMNQVLFTQLIQSLHRKAEGKNAAFEFLFQSVAVDNQTYKAQVKMYVLVRKIGENKDDNESVVSDLIYSIKNDMEDKNFTVSIFADDVTYTEFEESLSKCDYTRKLSVSKKEKAMANALSANGLTYYNEVIEPSENINPSTLINALSQYPDSVVSLQLMPTKYNLNELQVIEQTNNFYEHYVSEIRFRQGIRIRP